MLGQRTVPRRMENLSTVTALAYNMAALPEFGYPEMRASSRHHQQTEGRVASAGESSGLKFGGV